MQNKGKNKVITSLYVIILLLMFITFSSYFLEPLLVQARLVALKLNLSSSIQEGLYLANFTSKIKKGDIGIICVPSQLYANIAINSGLPISFFTCQYSTTPMLKHIVGQHGDSIKVTNNGIVVNGQLMKHSKPVPWLRAYALPVNMSSTAIKLSKDEYFVLGETDNSFDSRYFGVLSKEYILGNAILLWGF